MNASGKEKAAYLVNKQVFTKKGGLLLRSLVTLLGEQIPESQQRVLQLLDVERLPPDREEDMILERVMPLKHLKQ